MFFHCSKILFSLLNITTNSDSEPCIAIQPYLIFHEEESNEDLDLTMAHTATNRIKSMSLEMSVDFKTNIKEEIEGTYDLKSTQVYLTKFTRKIALDGTISDEQIYTLKDVIIPTTWIRVNNFRLYVSPYPFFETIGDEKKLCQFIALDYYNIRSWEYETVEILESFKSLIEFEINLECIYKFCIILKNKNSHHTSKNIHTKMFKVIFFDDGSLPKLEEVNQEIYITHYYP